ncbi:hypothetical protein VM57_17630 [Stenotrophomonas maltophilia]|uniref:Uncharacterized protein n=1 Tax=Stenotrophomonas maltophilia TaxID=40324 RepID=A0A0F5ZPJ9_STEMA|nr:hypothetical protein VM57_17630 [Stenotrophomonas maltophilia]
MHFHIQQQALMDVGPAFQHAIQFLPGLVQLLGVEQGTRGVEIGTKRRRADSWMATDGPSSPGNCNAGLSPRGPNSVTWSVLCMIDLPADGHGQCPVTASG